VGKNSGIDLKSNFFLISIRREIATKVLGTKMLQGYVLKETTCDRCGMPLMEHKGKVDCVVCPALAKKAKKTMKKQRKLEEEKSRIQQEIDANQALEKRMRYEQLEADRREKEERLQKWREEELERERRAKRQKQVEEEKARLLAMEKAEDERFLALEEEELRLLEEGKERSAEAARREKEAKRLSMAMREQEKQRLDEIQRETDAMLAAKYAAQATKEKEAAEDLLAAKRKMEEDALHIERVTMFAQKLAEQKVKQQEEEAALLEETRRLEHLETQTMVSKSQFMQRDLLEQQHNKRLKDKTILDAEVARLEHLRHEEELEVRRLAEERRAEEEAKMIAALEADAAAKALAAEDAIRKAKEALAAVSTTKREIIAQTIAMAEKEAVAETERELKAEQEDYKERVLLPSESQLYRERWETLRMEGRAIMTRRVLQGWKLLPEACQGAECEMSPLITKHGKKECVVCGGVGSGIDGVYAIDEFEEDDEQFDITTIDPSFLPEDIQLQVAKSLEGMEPDLPPAIEEDDFDKKRDEVSREIGKRLMMGWTLLDASCPHCVMPLMMDNDGNKDICVLCGPVEYFDASTIKTREMDYHIEKEESFKEEEKKDEVVEAETIDNIPLVDTTATLASEELAASRDDTLLAAIKERANLQKREAVLSDPPAFTKGLSKSMYALADSDDSDDAGPQSKPNNLPTPRAEPEEVITDEPERDEAAEGTITLTIPKDFDFTNPEALRDLINSNTKSQEDDMIEVTKSGAIYTAKDAMSTEMIAKMFLRSPHGYDFQDIGTDMTLEEVKELVDIFMVTNFNEPVPDDFKYEVARDILEKLKPEEDYIVEPPVLFDPETPTSGVIHLEHVASPVSQDENNPRTFHFDDYVETRSVKSARRSRPNPESLISSRSAKLPAKSPKPPRAGGSSKREGAPVIVGGPLSGGGRRYQHGNGSISGMSRAESVASDALESIYIRIDQCKTKLLDPKNTIEEQLATADLMEKLAKAAVAMKAMEALEHNE
jgi:uncharacterized Zn finger protein (UPF0148 family)